ncbi:MAG: hypothetical protein KME13_20000 [Myxacorys californica WJT36-NPBG1]|jgi:DNA-binding CsgD family transcriptional regulator|nr:hypothetical protein [Myxacorys californica WJT36-NPBG1]
MTARLISVPPELQLSIKSWFSQPSRKPSSPCSSRKQLSSNPPVFSIENHSPNKQERPAPDLGGQNRVSADLLWKVLLESIQEGVIVVSRSLQPIYLNHQAEEICQQLQGPREGLPAAIAEACHRLIREKMTTSEPLVVEYQGDSRQFIRLRVRWISFDAHPADEAPANYILVLLEDCYMALREELALEQKKYDLTDREAEIWLLLRQEYTYQEISDMLKISLNTVKTHIKNVYAKRRSLLRDRNVWHSR